METAQGHLNDIVRFSEVDGPGNRYVVLLQGCNLNCTVCHSPYRINECDSCGICVEPCPELAIFFDGRQEIAVDDDVCTHCGECIGVCPSDSTPLSTKIRLDTLVTRIKEVSPFIAGVTVSGGEPTIQSDFVASLFCAIKCNDHLSKLTTFVDSNGHTSRDVWDRLLPVMDGAMIDLKALDRETHLELAGAPNDHILDSIRYLAEWDRLWEVRLLLVPGKNDDPATIEKTAEWLRSIDSSMRIKLVGFRNDGVRKPHADIPDADPDHIARIADIVRGIGFPDPVIV